MIALNNRPTRLYCSPTLQLLVTFLLAALELNASKNDCDLCYHNKGIVKSLVVRVDYDKHTASN